MTVSEAQAILGNNVSQQDWTTQSCNSWEYDTSQYKSTIVTEVGTVVTNMLL